MRSASAHIASAKSPGSIWGRLRTSFQRSIVCSVILPQASSYSILLHTGRRPALCNRVQLRPRHQIQHAVRHDWGALHLLLHADLAQLGLLLAVPEDEDFAVFGAD